MSDRAIVFACLAVVVGSVAGGWTAWAIQEHRRRRRMTRRLRRLHDR